jgi:hypothetical protein
MPLSQNELNRFRQKCPVKGQEACCSGGKCTPVQVGEVILPCPQRALLLQEEAKINTLTGEKRNAQIKRAKSIRNSLVEIWDEACGRKKNMGGAKKGRSTKSKAGNRRYKTRRN